MTAANPILVCQHITKSFGATPAVRDLTLTLEKGKFLALLGPSGCGKTTSLRLIAGLEYPNSGQILLNGQSVADEHHWVPAHQRQIGLVFQDYALFPHLNVAQNVAYGLHGAHSQKQQRTAEVLELVGLAGLEKRMPYELSGGQQQRVALARALAPAPQIMLLDEPFSNLDASLRVQVRQEIRRILQETNITTVLVTHDQEEAFSIADEVGIMLDGKLEQTAPPRLLYQEPATPEIARFVGDANFIPAEANGDTAQCILGTIPLRSPQNGPVSLMIRPETLHLTPDENGSATVIESTYFGHDQVLKFNLMNTVLEARFSAYNQFSIGQRVSVGILAPAVAYPTKI